jgi:hypothetical protein
MAADFRNDPSAAKQFLQQGESPVDHSADPAELATWSSIASLLLNMDEAITKQ